jgi:hypothetical protein
MSKDEVAKNRINYCQASGYKQYLELLDVPDFFGSNVEWSEPSGDDLSSEWDSDQSARGDRLIDDEDIDSRIPSTKVRIRMLDHPPTPIAPPPLRQTHSALGSALKVLGRQVAHQEPNQTYLLFIYQIIANVSC